MNNMNYVSHDFEPRLGDVVVNNNKGCKHYGSIGKVVDIKDLPEDKGKTICYKCQNSGPNWKLGEILEKTPDQLSPKSKNRLYSENKLIRDFIKNIISRNGF